MKLTMLVDTVVAPGKFAKAKEVVEIQSDEIAALLITKGRAVKTPDAPVPPATPTPAAPPVKP